MTIIIQSWESPQPKYRPPLLLKNNYIYDHIGENNRRKKIKKYMKKFQNRNIYIYIYVICIYYLYK